ncbi:1e1cc225-9d63-4663-b918-180c7e30f03f [Thermothielavioides terrestris]|uniref:1e1cc225-9d63-4663-b918-180c7e30f03f n=1 Tax=Thermothielavioides terrestris TaxID=2587410 RepID=A0A446BJI3_9PEZI|nr:1e1cc225-9d63-4663-b918-180c7e30f03f [Thermothielavioides terrestris]
MPNWFIRPGQLHCLLTTIFPNGEYDVDIDQDVYKIRAPRAISLRDIIRFKRY